MKPLLITLLAALSFSAAAETVATMPNQGGGQIRLTDEACTLPGQRGFLAYSFVMNETPLLGCWVPIDDQVLWSIPTEMRACTPHPNSAPIQDPKGPFSNSGLRAAQLAVQASRSPKCGARTGRP